MTSSGRECDLPPDLFKPATRTLRRHDRRGGLMSGIVFINYRRKDAAGMAGRLFDHLEHCLLYTSPSPRD